MGRYARRTTIALGLGLAALASCKSDSTGPGGSVNLAGNYSLLTFKEDTLPSFGPPVAVGTLVLTSSNYNLSLGVYIPLPGDTTVIADSGTYTARGDSIFEHSSTGIPDAVGTFSLVGGTLSINVTESTLKIATTWHKN